MVMKSVFPLLKGGLVAHMLNPNRTKHHWWMGPEGTATACMRNGVGRRKKMIPRSNLYRSLRTALGEGENGRDCRSAVLSSIVGSRRNDPDSPPPTDGQLPNGCLIAAANYGTLTRKISLKDNNACGICRCGALWSKWVEPCTSSQIVRLSQDTAIPSQSRSRCGRDEPTGPN
jgi:hypothetical protein